MPAARLIVWDDAACWRVHEATLALLEETGVEVRHAGAREQLAEAGARVEGTRARIPAALVDAALQSAPRHFKLRERGASGGEGHARRGELGGLELEDGKSYFGTGSDCVYVTDPDTGERRRQHDRRRRGHGRPGREAAQPRLRHEHGPAERRARPRSATSPSSPPCWPARASRC